MSNMRIYKITNKLNGKMYIGQTTHTIEWRWKRHIKAMQDGSQTNLYKAMRKYGVENFTIEEICRTTSKEELNRLEIYYIGLYNSTKTGYNMTGGGDDNFMFNPGVKEKHDAIMRSPEVRNKISQSMKEYRASHPFSEEHRRKLSEKAVGNHNFGSGDTRSIGCYCITKDGQELHFHSYRDAWNWWKMTDNPFNTDTECIYQRKIKQSISKGYYTYGRNKVHYEYPKWYKEESGVIR